MKRIMMLLMSLLASSSAFADGVLSGNLFDPVPDSKAIWVLKGVFGGLLGGGGDPLNTAISMFNSCILIVGGVLAGYVMFSGILNTAHDGEIFGKKYSAAWIPIRYSVGISLIVPFLKGYCVIQAIVMWVAVQGVGLADKVWSETMSSQNLQQYVSTGLTRPEAMQLGLKIYESQLCMAILTYEKGTQDGITLGYSGMQLGTTTNDTGSDIVLSFGATNDVIAHQNTCGTVTIHKFTAPAVPTTSLGNLSALTLTGDALQRMVAINQDNIQQVNVLISAIAPVAANDVANVVKGGKITDVAGVRSAVDAYEEHLREKASELVLAMQNNNELSQAATQDGFITAGSFYTKLSSVNDMVSRSVASIPSATGSGEMGLATTADIQATVFKQVQEVYNSTKGAGTITFGVGKQEGGSESGWWKTVKDAVAGGLDPRVLAKKAFTDTAGFVLNDGENPVMAVQRMGQYSLGTASTATGLLMLANVTTGITPGIASTISDIIKIVVPPMLLVGMTLSYVIPMLPAFIFYMSAFGWAVSVCMAIVASPLWIVAHLSPEGHDMMGKGVAGYQLVLSLLLRPVLMIFGMLCGIVLVSVFGQLLNRIFADTFIMSQTDSGFFTLIFGELIAAPILYACFVVILLRKSFGLIHEVPDHILKWIGGGDSWGAYGQAGGAEGAFAAAGAGMQAVGGVANKIGSPNGKESVKNEDKGNPFQDLKDRALAGSMSEKDGLNGGGTGGERSLSDIQGEAQQAQQEANEGYLNNAVEAMGGEGSKEAESMLKNVAASREKDPSTPFGKHVDNAVARELNHKYGAGVAAAVHAMSGGFSGEKFQDALSTFSGKASELDQAGLGGGEIKKAFAGAVADAKKDYTSHKAEAAKQGEEVKPFGQFMHDSLGRINTSSERID